MSPCDTSCLLYDILSHCKVGSVNLKHYYKWTVTTHNTAKWVLTLCLALPAKWSKYFVWVYNTFKWIMTAYYTDC